MKSIGIKLWAGMMAMVIVVLLLLWFFQIVFLESFYNNMRISAIKEEGVSLVKMLDQGGMTSEFKNKLDAFAFRNNLSIDLLDSAGKAVYLTGSTTNGPMAMLQNNARIYAFQEALTGKELTVPLTHPRFGNKFMLLGFPVKYSGQIMGVLLINMPLAPVEDTALILKKQLIIITFILLIAAIIISFIISKTFTRPILEIKRVSEQMAAGDFSPRITDRNKDEIGQLAETINYLGKQLAKVEQLRKDLIANVSHELRTPLSLIRGYAETIRDVSGDVPEKREKQLGIIIEETERLSKIVDDILNLSQLQSGYVTLNKSSFLIWKTLEVVVSRYEVLSQETGVQIVLRGSSDGFVEADEARIEQVMFNLIINGFNHTPRGGIITVSVHDLPETVKVEVSDTGSGIPEEQLSHIWQRFYKAEKTRDKRILGTGLGLAIVKSILDVHQVAYGVNSQREVGTTFWFELKKTFN
ncbi:ATP-binding protein [Desulfotomaculum defluvii]